MTAREAAMTKKEIERHALAKRRAERFTEILAGFAKNPASAWYNMPLEIDEIPRAKKVPSKRGGRQDLAPIASTFKVWAQGRHFRVYVAEF